MAIVFEEKDSYVGREVSGSVRVEWGRLERGGGEEGTEGVMEEGKEGQRKGRREGGREGGVEGGREGGRDRKRKAGLI